MKALTLKEARAKAKLTQDELAAASGIDQTTISCIETNRAINPRAETVFKLARALDIDPRRLRFGYAVSAPVIS